MIFYSLVPFGDITPFFHGFLILFYFSRTVQKTTSFRGAGHQLHGRMVHPCISSRGLLHRCQFSLSHWAPPKSGVPPAYHTAEFHGPDHNPALFIATNSLQMETTTESLNSDKNTHATHPISKNAQKKLLKQQRYEAKKAEKKAQMKEHKKREAERRRKEWDEKLASVGEDEREKLIEGKRGLRKERMEKRNKERGRKIERLNEAMISGQNVVIDLEFSDLMSSAELHSLVQQIMYCYAINGRCALPAHLWLTGCQGEMQNQLQRIPGYDKWIIKKEDKSYIEAFQDQKDKLVYLTADSESVLDELDSKAIYIIGGLVDRNRWKGITMNKAKEQGIKTAKLPIGNYLKMSSSQVLTVNQVVEILLKYLETTDWKDSFFQVIPQRKRCEAGSEENEAELERKGTVEEEEGKGAGTLQAKDNEDEDGHEIRKVEGNDIAGIDDQKIKRQCIETQTVS